MKDITLMDILYTAGMLFFVFYGSILLTKLLSKGEEDEQNNSEESQEK
jgi:arginine exporter protein ArgO